jgi:hypothetical protein
MAKIHSSTLCKGLNHGLTIFVHVLQLLLVVFQLHLQLLVLLHLAFNLLHLVIARHQFLALFQFGVCKLLIEIRIGLGKLCKRLSELVDLFLQPLVVAHPHCTRSPCMPCQDPLSFFRFARRCIQACKAGETFPYPHTSFGHGMLPREAFRQMEMRGEICCALLQVGPRTKHKGSRQKTMLRGVHNLRISIFDLLVLSFDHDQKDMTRKTNMARDIKRLLALILQTVDGTYRPGTTKDLTDCKVVLEGRDGGFDFWNAFVWLVVKDS